MRLSWPVVLVSLAACGGQPPIEEVFSDCDPLDLALCTLPFPSAFHLTADETTETGFRVNYSATALPINQDGGDMYPDFFNEPDGFATGGPLLTFFADLAGEGLMGHQDLDGYTADDVTTVLVNVSTGERVPHFAEIDQMSKEDSQRLLLIYPVEPLDFETRYVVGIRGLQTTAGASVESSEAFSALRDGTETQDWDVEGRRAHFDEVVFPALEATGFAQAELQLAWDFVTHSRRGSWGRMEFLRDDLLEGLPEDGPAYEITEVEEGDCSAGESIGRTIYGTVEVPLYMEADDSGTFLTRGDDGMPYVNGTTHPEFMVRVPCSLLEEPAPGLILQYGHGLLGDYSEARTGYLSEMADRYGWVVVAASWTGMSEDDLNDILLMTADDLGSFAIIPERSAQGFMEKIAILEAMKGALGQDAYLTVDGVSLVDPERVGYYGNSQGGILGGAYLALNPALERGVLGVGGGPYGVLLPRSYDFDLYLNILRSKFEDHRQIMQVIGLMSMLWEPAEGAGWFHDMNRSPADGQQAKDVLLQVAIGDAQVSTLGAHMMARAYGASTVYPQTRAVYGVEEQVGGFTGSALVEWTYPDGAAEPVENVPPDADLDTHECPRREVAAQDQLRDFVETGVVNQYCVDEKGAPAICEGVRTGFCD